MRLLLAGTPRCGSTWATNVLGRAEHTRSVYEPDGPFSDVLGAMVATRLGNFPGLSVDEQSGWYRRVWDLAFAGGWPWDRVEAARSAGRRLVRVPPVVRDYAVVGLAAATSRVRPRPQNVVVKSVNSAFSLEWIAHRYQPTVVVLRRNPLNVVSSWVVLNMWLDETLGGSTHVRETYLRPLGLNAPPADASLVTRAAWNVGLLTLALKTAAERHPEWIVVSHDLLCVDPVTGYRTLFERLGLGWSPAVDDYLTRSDDPGFVVHGGTARAHPNATSSTEPVSRRDQQESQFKRRLTEDQIREARSVLDSIPLGDWGPPPA